MVSTYILIPYTVWQGRNDNEPATINANCFFHPSVRQFPHHQKDTRCKIQDAEAPGIEAYLSIRRKGMGLNATPQVAS